MSQLYGAPPNNSFKPNLLRSTKAMAEKACHGFGSTTQVGLTLALGLRATIMVNATDKNFSYRPAAHLHLANDPTKNIGRGQVSAQFLFGAACFNVYFAAFPLDPKGSL